MLHYIAKKILNLHATNDVICDVCPQANSQGFHSLEARINLPIVLNLFMSTYLYSIK